MKITYLIRGIFLGMILFPLAMYGQECGGVKPSWAAEGSFYKKLDNSYLEMVIETGRSFEEVREKAKEEIQIRRKKAVGNENAWIKFKTIAEHWECKHGEYTGYILFQTLANPTYEYEGIVITNHYPFSARVFVPGMAQIHKGSVKKGGVIIAGEAIFIGGIVVSEVMRAQYNTKYKSTHNGSLKQDYLNNIRTCEIIRNVSIGGAALIYVYNIIDGIVAKGKPHILANGKPIVFIPYATPNGGGISLTINLNNSKNINR
jgi:hypothetical protein